LNNRNSNKEKKNKNKIIINKKNQNFLNQDNNYELDELEENKLNKNSKPKKDKNIKINNKRNKIKGERNEEEEFEENEDEEGFEFFEEINENNKRIIKLKKIRGNKKIRIKKSNSISNDEFAKICKPKEYKPFEDSLKEINNNKKSNSLDKIDKRKSISNILNINNRL
jgi:hypothetical protein